MYWERQKGNLCRLHALNAYFGYQRLNETDFFSYCDEYDSLIPGLNSRSMDGFSEGRCIINYIIGKIDNVYSLTIPINSYSDSREYIDIEHYTNTLRTCSFYFEFNKGHIWLNKKKDNMWYKLDSITGITHIDPHLKNNGYIIVFNKQDTLNEMNYYRKFIKTKTEFNTLEIYVCNLYHASSVIQGKHPLYFLIEKILLLFINTYRKSDFLSCKKIILLLKKVIE
tara:strand:+ start:882 stop:1556 length:675 start_codon:yes stop_codon:yes gene_type:complete